VARRGLPELLEALWLRVRDVVAEEEPEEELYRP
jgi:hypothetical protein